MRALINTNRKQCFNNAKKDDLKSKFLDRISRPLQRFSGTSRDIFYVQNTEINGTQRAPKTQEKYTVIILNYSQLEKHANQFYQGQERSHVRVEVF